MKITLTVNGSAVVKIPDGVHLAVPAMGTTPGQMNISVNGSSLEEVRQKLVELYDNMAEAVWGEEGKP